MRFTQRRTSPDDCLRYVQTHEDQRPVVGCAPWTIVSKSEGEIVGYGGLYDDPFEPGWGVEVGYFFRPQSWGRGYATELTLACLGLAVRLRRWPTITAFAHPDNIGSMRVLEKSGFDRRRFASAMQRWLYGWDLPPT